MKSPDVVKILKESKNIAVLGVKAEQGEVSNDIFNYLINKKYTVFGVNPKIAGTTVSDRPVTATLAEIKTPIDIVDIFRASQHLPMHVNDILAMNPLPKVVWFQQGVQNDDVAKILEEKGIEVIQNYCIAVAYSTNNHLITQA